MDIKASIPLAELASFFQGFFPVDVEFFNDAKRRRYLALHSPRDVQMVPAQGVRITCDAEIHWPVLLDVTVAVREITILMKASTVSTENGRGLRFAGQLEELDVRMLPRPIDEAVVNEINRRIRKSDTGFTWNFSETLTLSIDMPAEVVPIAAFTTGVENGSLTIDQRGLTLETSMDLAFERDRKEAYVLRDRTEP